MKTHKDKIVIAENAGFCFGVRRAIDTAENEAAKAAERGGSRVFSLGHLIHNDTVVRNLEKMGVQVIGSLSEAEAGDTVIIRSHGEPRRVYLEAEERGIRLVDATCPFVDKIHRLVNETELPVLIAGDEKHPEVKGIAGWCREESPVLIADSRDKTAREIREKAPGAKNFFVVAQTTIKQEMLDEITEELTGK